MSQRFSSLFMAFLTLNIKSVFAIHLPEKKDLASPRVLLRTFGWIVLAIFLVADFGFLFAMMDIGMYNALAFGFNFYLQTMMARINDPVLLQKMLSQGQLNFADIADWWPPAWLTMQAIAKGSSAVSTIAATLANMALGAALALNMAGLAIDTFWPRLSWENPMSALKRNPNTVITILGSMGFLVGLGILAVTLLSANYTFAIVYGTVFVAVCVVLGLVLFHVGPKKLR